MFSTHSIKYCDLLATDQVLSIFSMLYYVLFFYFICVHANTAINQSEMHSNVVLV